MLVTQWLPVHGDKLAFGYDQGGPLQDRVGIRVGPALATGDVAVALEIVSCVCGGLWLVVLSLFRRSAVFWVVNLVSAYFTEKGQEACERYFWKNASEAYGLGLK